MATSTVGPSQTYSTLASWESNVGGSISADEIAECYGGANLGVVVISGWSMSGGARAIIRAASGEKHTGTYDNTQGAYIEWSSGDGIEVSNPGNVLIQDLQLSSTNAGRGILASNSSTWNVTVERCVIRATSGGWWAVVFNGGSACTLRNTLVYDYGTVAGTGGFQENFSTHNNLISNCTFHNCAVGVEYYNGSATTGPVVRNCIVSSPTGAAFAYDGSATGWGSGTDYNISTTGTATGGSNDTVSWTEDYTDSANDDYSLANDASGVDLSGTFTDDILGVTRSAWTIGAFEFSSGTTYQESLSDAFDFGDVLSKAFNYVASIITTKFNDITE